MLGAADIARGAVLPAIATSRNGEVAAVASRAPQRARELIAPYAGARALDSYEAVLAAPDVDAVYIPLVNSLHCEWSVRALEAGKHVLCEKPLATNADEAEKMAAAADRTDRRLMEAFMYRFLPDMRAFVEQVRDPIHVMASFGFTLRDMSNYRLKAELGGGALLDVGCYVVSVSRWLLGEPVSVTARARTEHGVDMTVAALLEFPAGTTASIFASFEAPEEQELRVITEHHLRERHRPFGSPHEPHNPYQLMVESFGESVLRGAPVAIPPQESVANMRVLDRIREAASS